MGYNTDFSGELVITPPLSEAHRAYLEAFSQRRRMKRNASITATYPDPVREAAGLLVGPQGDFYVGDPDICGQTETPDIIDFSSPPDAQPSLWCQWIPGEHPEVHSTIEWDGGEKFHDYEDWLDFIINTFLKPWGYTANGAISWQGEDSDDLGLMEVKENVLTVKQGRIVYNTAQPDDLYKATRELLVNNLNELDTPMGYALAVAIEAMGGWGDFTADDFFQFVELELPRQIAFAGLDDTIPMV